MKKIIFLIFTLIIFSACTYIVGEKNEIPNTNVTYQIVVIDSCEYIIGTDNGPYNGGYFVTHKGNCKNSIHKTGK